MWVGAACILEFCKRHLALAQHEPTSQSLPGNAGKRTSPVATLPSTVSPDALVAHGVTGVRALATSAPGLVQRTLQSHSAMCL